MATFGICHSEGSQSSPRLSPAPSDQQERGGGRAWRTTEESKHNVLSPGRALSVAAGGDLHSSSLGPRYPMRNLKETLLSGCSGDPVTKARVTVERCGSSSRVGGGVLKMHTNPAHTSCSLRSMSHTSRDLALSIMLMHATPPLTSSCQTRPCPCSPPPLPPPLLLTGW